MRNIFFLLLFCMLPFLVFTQLPNTEDGAFSTYNSGLVSFQQGLYLKAMDDFEAFLDQIENVDHTSLKRREIEAEYYRAICAIKLDLPEAENLFVDFVNDYNPDPLVFLATIEIADYYFDRRDYDAAYQYYDQIGTSDIPQSKREEILFKKGYVLFNKGSYQQARGQFNIISNVPGEYYYSSNYYIAMSYYRQGAYDKSLPYFEKIEKSRKYERFIPAYKSQILFELEQYDAVIDYAPEKLEESRVQEKDKIAYVLGLSYLQKKQYELGLPHLVAYSKRNRMSSDDYYQLAYAQYKTGRYEEAIASFSRVSDENNRRGQNANLYLADAYLNLNDKESARNAFANASRRGSDEKVAMEAAFNYGKLSAEMGIDREATTALSKIPPDSDYYSEAQQILSDVFIRTRDYDKAISIIEDMDNPSSELRAAYQQITYHKASQLFREKDYKSALDYYEKSLKNPVDAQLVAQATFWKAEIYARTKNYDESSSLLLNYLDQTKGLSQLPANSRPYMGNYLLGYNYLKQEKYGRAERYFKETADGIRMQRVNIKNRYITTNIYSDALLRYGDCMFKLNKYDAAVNSYQKVIDRKSGEFVYAQFQKSIIQGLQKKQNQKVNTLENLIQNYPNSTYADDALLELGKELTNMGQLNKAIQPLNRLVTDYAATSDLVVEALLRLGLLSYNLGDTKTALNYYKTIFDRNPNPQQSSDALTAIEEIYVEDMGQPDAYVRFLEEKSGVSLGQQSKDSLNFKAAEAQFANGNYKRAAEAYQNYLNQFPNGIHALSAAFQMGESYLAEGNYTEALKGYELVIEKGPSPYYAPACQKAAIISYNHTEDFVKSTEYFQRWAKVAKSEDDELTAQIGGMEASYRAKDGDAVRSLSDRIFQNPRASKDQKGKAMFYRGKIAFDNSRYEQARSAFEEAIELTDDERTAESRYLVAKTYYLENDFDKAEERSRNAYKESSAYPYWVARSLILLSDVLVKKDDIFNAKAALEAVIENFGESEEILSEAESKLQTLKERTNE